MSEVFWNVGCYLFAIAILVGFHEFGHYWVARRCGVKVLRFSIGFGKVLWSRRAADGVEWSLSAIPLGGYVKMLDEREGEVAPAERHLAFNNATVLRRSLIVAAGPVFNFLLAIAFYWLVFVIGAEGIKPMLAEPPAQSAAARAGLHEGEQVMRVDGRSVITWTELRTELISHALDGGSMQLDVQGRDGAQRSVKLDLSEVRVDPAVLFDDLGLEIYQPPVPARVGDLAPGEAAASAGIHAGDLLLTRNGEPVGNWRDWTKWVREHAGEVVQIGIERDGQHLNVPVIIGRTQLDGKTVGRFGAYNAPMPRELWQNLRAQTRLGALEAVPAAAIHTWRMSKLTARLLFLMVRGDVSIKNISGPINTAQAVGTAAHFGLVPFL
ncbi:MAG TPA: RIP metalloprotease RseP, partial [Nevskiaceae bacterium]|nr:RIP metalloprotease RseP [Nevskiaceae bacterium]